MGSNMPQRGVEAGGGNSDSTLLTPDQGALFDPPELTPEEFLRRLLRREHKAAVALEYYPAVSKKTKKPLVGADLDKHLKNAVENVDRMLEGHRAATVKLFDCCRRVIPGAGVAIAHFFADRCGTERGAPKLDAIRLQDEVLAISASIERSDKEKAVAMQRLAVLQAWISQQPRTR